MSESINAVVLSGNLTRDPELRQTQGGAAVLSLRMASNGRRKNGQTGQWEDDPCFVGVTVWGARAESLARVLAKGMRVTVQGRLRWREWQDKGGARRESLEVVADNVELPPRQQGGQAAPQAPACSPQPGGYRAAMTAPQYSPQLQGAVDAGFAAVPTQQAQPALYDDEIPF